MLHVLMTFCLEPFSNSILHIAWSRVLLQKLTGSQPVKKFPAFYATRSFITTFTPARPLSILAQNLSYCDDIADTWPFKTRTKMNTPQTLCKFTTRTTFKNFMLFSKQT